MIEAPGASEHPYVRQFQLNGKSLDKPALPFAEVAAGGKLVLEMGDQPVDSYKNGLTQ